MAVMLGIALLFVPGYLFCRTIGLQGLSAISCAPLFSISAYGAVGIIFYYVGVYSTTFSVGTTVLIISLCAYGIAYIIRRWRVPSFAISDTHGSLFDLSCVALYVFVGITVALFVFILPLDGAGSSIQTYDNVHHFSLVQSFMESGKWSTLHTSAYLEVFEEHANPLPGTAYYPAGWHLLCAMLAQGLGISVSISANAINFLFVAVVFPIGMALLMRRLFPDSRSVVLFGAFAVPVIGAFPWVIVEVWPLYPNVTSIALLPAFASCFLMLCAHNSSRNLRISSAVTLMVGIVCMAFLQPNALFAAAVFLLPYCVYRVGEIVSQRFAGSRHRRAIVAASCALVALAGVLAWLLLCNIPFLQNVIEYYWPPIHSRLQGLISIAALSFAQSTVQPVAAAFVAIGALHALRSPKYRWITCSYLLMCFIYWISATETNTWLKHIISGFWYTDSSRTGACAAVFALPLLAMGLQTVYHAFIKAIKKRRLPSRQSPVFTRRVSILSAAVVVTVFFALNFLPVRGILGLGQDTFQGIAAIAEDLNNGSAMNAYSKDKSQFVKKVEQIIPPQALVINQPYDGSLFAYGLDNLNTYYRDMSGYGTDGERQESTLIRGHLAETTSNNAVQEVLRLTGAQYVLILDRNVKNMMDCFILYNPPDWTGIEKVTEDTPGFEMILSEGDMSLYRIEDTAILQ